MRAALVRYRVMAYLVGIGLLVLTAVGVPLQYVWGKPAVVSIVGPIHGFLYIIYLIAAADLARRDRWTLPQMAAVVCAGFVPILAFVVERYTTHRVERHLAEQEAGAPGAGAAPGGPGEPAAFTDGVGTDPTSQAGMSDPAAGGPPPVGPTPA